jgi:hypothetical protein
MVEMNSDEAILQQMGYKQASNYFIHSMPSLLATSPVNAHCYRNYDDHGHHFETFAYAFPP